MTEYLAEVGLAIFVGLFIRHATFLRSHRLKQIRQITVLTADLENLKSSVVSPKEMAVLESDLNNLKAVVVSEHRVQEMIKNELRDQLGPLIHQLDKIEDKLDNRLNSIDKKLDQKLENINNQLMQTAIQSGVVAGIAKSDNHS